MPATHAAASATPAATCRERLSARDASPARMSKAFPLPPNPLVASAAIPPVVDEEDEADDVSDRDEKVEDAGLAGSTPVGIAVAVTELVEI